MLGYEESAGKFLDQDQAGIREGVEYLSIDKLMLEALPDLGKVLLGATLWLPQDIQEYSQSLRVFSVR